MKKRFSILVGVLALYACETGKAPPKNGVFVGYITDTECGPDHARMLATGTMGGSDESCTRLCVQKGATYGFVDEARKSFYQLDDQEKPARYAGAKVKITGRLEGDTIFVQEIGPAR